MWFTQSIQTFKTLLVYCLSATLLFSSPQSIAKADKQDNNQEATYRIEGQLRPEKQRIPILMYHDLSENPDRWNANTISPEQFTEDMLLLKRLGYTTIHFRDYFKSLSGQYELPPNPVIVTFDDGYTSNYTYAYPVLKKLNMKATIFIVGWSVGLVDYMPERRLAIAFRPHFSWAQAKEMYESGLVDIQHHTYDLHQEKTTPLGKGRKVSIGVSKYLKESQDSYEKRFTEDVLKNKALIESQLGNKVEYFAYPYGIYNGTTEKILKKLGFKATVTIKPGISSLSDPYTLMRINAVSSDQSLFLMRKILEAQGQTVAISVGAGDRKARCTILEAELEKHAISQSPPTNP